MGSRHVNLDHPMHSPLSQSTAEIRRPPCNAGLSPFLSDSANRKPRLSRLLSFPSLGFRGCSFLPRGFAMAKKRKSDAARLDEGGRTMYSSFCGAANALSQVYTQAMGQQKVAFQAGERHALEKLYQWILRQHEETSRVTAADIVAYLQNEIDYGGEDVQMSPRPQVPHQSNPQSTNSSIQSSYGLSEQATMGFAPRPGLSHGDQAKDSVFSNALSSPICPSLPTYHLSPGGEYILESALANGTGSQNHQANFPNQNRYMNSKDSSMDMH